MRIIDADALKYRRKEYGGYDDVSMKERKKGILYLLKEDIDDEPTILLESEDKIREQGEWDMFELITSVYFGKQYYFLDNTGIVYSRESHRHMTKDDAIREFLDIIGE